MARPAQTKSEAIQQLEDLVRAFGANEARFKNSAYKESQLRNDFLNKLLKAFGWDVDNELGKSQKLRDVLQEEELEVEDDDVIKIKNPDYTLQIVGTRKLFVEAKKASINIDHALGPAFQTRRYGWNGKLNLSVLTNFDRLVFYDCRTKPAATDAAHVARYRSYHYTEFVAKYDEISELLGFAAVEGGAVDNIFAEDNTVGTPFDDYFLDQISGWRLALAQDIISSNPGLDELEINFQVQRLLNRIVFLRICEDRALERYETLHRITSYEELKALFQDADAKYNSGLFDFIEDELSLKLVLNSELLIGIFNELYYPHSPYDFSVVDPEILSQIYERFLGNRVAVDGEGNAHIIPEPEVDASSGVVSTPKLVVRKIVRDTLGPLCAGKSFAELLDLKVADISCGSGTFLISVYDYLLEQLTEQAGDAQMRAGLARLGIGGAKQITLLGKQELLTQCVYGVDINPYAVEVASFSLSLKLLEGESGATIADHLEQAGATVLPSFNETVRCGNSLIGDDFFSFNPDALTDDELSLRVRPFEWRNEFPFFAQKNGFDAIVGNPPYVRIQNMVRYAPEETAYYQSEAAGYIAAQRGSSFDKYYLFIQRGLELLNETGYLGYIVPHKFFTLKGAKALRQYITGNSSLAKIVHFGVLQLFPGHMTYTAIVVLSKQPAASFGFTRVRDVARELLLDQASSRYYNQDFGAEPWVFVSPETETLFGRIRGNNTVALDNIADIPTGLQTSADKIYIIKDAVEVGANLRFTTGRNRERKTWEIEKGICVPCLMDKPFEPFDTIRANAWMLYPYVRVNGQAVLLNASDFQAMYPLAWDYLNQHRNQLTARNINKSGPKDPVTGELIWYQFGRNQYLNTFIRAPKLIFPVLSQRPKYVYDETNMQFTGGGSGPYYAIISQSEYSPLYIMAILNHPIFEAMVKARASEFSGEFYAHNNSSLKDLPIRRIDFSSATERGLHDEIVKTVAGLIEAKAKARATSVPANRVVHLRKAGLLETRMQAQVAALYGLDDGDISTVAEDEILYGRVTEQE